MMMVYLNYPNPRISVHENPHCNNIQKMRKPHQRRYPISVDTVSAELRDIGTPDSHRYQFAPNQEHNDMWLEVDFQDTDFERAIVYHIQRLLSRRYTPFGTVEVTFDECTS